MRWALFGFVLMLIVGCVQETAEIPGYTETQGVPEEIITVIEEEPKLPPENATNITEEIIGEEKIEEVNETVEFNETVNETDDSFNETITEHKEVEGIYFAGGRYVLILDDVAWYGDKSCAIVTIAYADGTAIKKDVMCPRTDYYWTDSAGMRFRFKVISVAAGYTGEAWANIIIYG